MKKAKKFIALMLSTAIMLIGQTGVSAISVSPALDIIAYEYGMTKVSLVSRDVYFTAEDFKEASGIEKISKINIVSLPDASCGTLMLGNIALNENQSVSKKNIDNLRFVPRMGTEMETSFKFSVNGDNGGAYTCSIYFLDSENAAPTVNSNGDCYLEVSTYGGITLYGAMKATDPENDSLKYEIISMPGHGTLTVTNKNTGSYRYVPDSGFSGEDSFSYIAVDKYGNKSETATVTVNVEKPDSNIVFSDMSEHWAHSEAIKAVSAGTMKFTSDNGIYTFSPDKPISRAEFCAAVMKAAGYDGFTSVNGTGFDDDSDIPDEYKGLISVAKMLGVANGYESSGKLCFYPNNQITRAEAAVMINKLFSFENTGDIQVFADSDSVPVWAVGSMSALCSAGIMKGDANGNISAYDGLTRAHAAVLISNLLMSK